MAKKITNVDEWNAALNPRTYQGPDDEEPANYGDGGCGGCCTMPSCLQPKVEYKSVSGSATLAGFLATDSSGSGSDSGEVKRYRTKSQTIGGSSSSTRETNFPGGSGKYVSHTSSNNIIYKKKSNYDQDFEGSISAPPNTDFRECPRTEGLKEVFSVSGTASSADFEHYRATPSDPWTVRGVGTSITTVKLIAGELNTNTTASDDRWPAGWFEVTTIAKNLLTGTSVTATSAVTPFNGSTGTVDFSDEIEVSAALIAAESWLDSQAGIMLARDSEGTPVVESSASSDSIPECALGSHYIASTTVRDAASSPESIQLVGKSYFKYRFKLHRCSGQYSGLSWLEIFYSTQLQNWLNPYHPSYHVGVRPAGPATASKSWEGAGAGADPRCRAGTSQPYPDDKTHADASLWSPWSLRVDSPASAGNGSKYLTAIYLSCYRSIYGTVPTKVNGYGDYNSDE